MEPEALVGVLELEEAGVPGVPELPLALPYPPPYPPYSLPYPLPVVGVPV